MFTNGGTCHSRRRNSGGTGAGAAPDSTARLVEASGTYHYPNGSGSEQWSLDTPTNIPYENIRGALSIDDNGIASIFASVRTGDAMTVTRFADNMVIQTFKREAGSGAKVGGTESTFDFGSHSIKAGSDVGAGSSGQFSYEAASPTNPPSGDFAR